MKQILLSRMGLGMAAGVLLAGAGMAEAQVNIELVPVGDAGNVADTTVHGRVDYAYNIGKYEVTAGQYTVFLNAVGGVDTYGLYSTGMSLIDYNYDYERAHCGITRSGGGTVGNPYTYTVHPDFVNRPVNYVSFWDACRFTNWLQNGQKTGAQDTTTTEDGAYTLTETTITANTVMRNTDWQWAVTSEDEWYKAAYFKGGSTNAGYWSYPTSSDTAPGRDLADANGNNANYYIESYAIPNDLDKYTTVVGEFQNSDSPYGTFDQAGNVVEWTDTIYGGLSRVLLGTSFFNPNSSGQYGYCSDDFPPYEVSDLGFRVVQIPEPASIALLALGGLGMLMRRRGAAK